VKQAIENMYHDLKGNDLEAMVQQSFQNELIEAMNEDLGDQAEIIAKVGYQDFVNYGVIAELVGRIGFIAAFKKLGEDEILKILKRPTNNIIDLYKNYFHLHQDSLEIKEEVYPLIAEEVAKRQIGTRSINTILVQLIQDLLFIAPDKKKDQFVIDAKYFQEKINNN
jgi:ATP-dependent protease Clp ATPase subunit